MNLLWILDVHTYIIINDYTKKRAILIIKGPKQSSNWALFFNNSGVVCNISIATDGHHRPRQRPSLMKLVPVVLSLFFATVVVITFLPEVVVYISISSYRFLWKEVCHRRLYSSLQSSLFPPSRSSAISKLFF